jgi:splicing factor 3A subunit 1
MVISGVIRPPPDIRAVADKTALFVAKNGRAFEERILNSEKGKTPKFAFLHTTSPFHSYYEQRIRFHEEGGNGDDDDDAKKEDSEEKKEEDGEKKPSAREERKQDKAQKASAVDPVARALLLQRNNIREARTAVEAHEANDNSPPLEGVVLPPPPLRFVTAAAPKIPAVQLETIKLAAQFTALDGKGGPFLQDLAIREWNNPSFGFLQPRHGHFAYFSALVDGYRHILSTWTKPDAEDLSAHNLDKSLEIAAYRAEYDRDVAERERAAMAENDGPLSGAALIDWHHFTVVETIEFPIDENVQLTLPPPPPKAVSIDHDDGGMDESDDEEEGETIRVVPSYKPKVVSTQSIAADASRTHVIDPVTGRSIPVADMPEHMRIQFLDPKWAEEKKIFMDKQKESNLVGGDAIAANISRLAQVRGDVDLATDTDSKKRRLDVANRVIREQAQLPPPGPTLPTYHPPESNLQPPPLIAATGDAAISPLAKRARLEVTPPIPPPPSLPPPPTGMMPPPPPPNAAMMPPPGLPPDLGPPPPPGEPETRELLSESDFCASLQSPTVSLRIQFPEDPSASAWNFNGQVVTLMVDVMSKVKAVKMELQSHLGGMPTNKVQLKHEGTGFLKDGVTLAHHNIGPSADLELILKTRGGRK